MMATFPMLRLQSGTKALVLGKCPGVEEAEVERRATIYSVEAVLKSKVNMSYAAR
jgi:hypothetical protein